MQLYLDHVYKAKLEDYSLEEDESDDSIDEFDCVDTSNGVDDMHNKDIFEGEE